MGEPRAALRIGGAGENLPAGVNLPAGGSEGSDDSLQGETPGNRGDADGLLSSEVMGVGGASVKEVEGRTKGEVLVLYAEKGKERVRMELRGDPFEVGNQVRARMFPGVRVPAVDEKFDQIMRKRKEDERRAK